LQTDAAINPWNSWWPLINLTWEVVWINTAIVDGSNWVWFAIPLTPLRMQKLLENIKK
jgi:S1-C subfamily serine protease